MLAAQNNRFGDESFFQFADSTGEHGPGGHHAGLAADVFHGPALDGISHGVAGVGCGVVRW